MNKLHEKFKEEFGALLPPAIFFLIALHLVALVRTLMLKGTGITVGTSITVTVAALILAKAVLLSDLLPFIDLFPHKPLVYNIAWKTALYTLAATLIHYIERLIDFWREAGGFIAGNAKMLSEIVWPHFLAIQIFLVIVIFVYCTARELVRVIGTDRMRKIFFGLPRRETVSG